MSKEIKIRGLQTSDVEYLKAMAKKEKADSFNQFMVKLCQDKIHQGQFNQAEHLYLAHLEQMVETTDFFRKQLEKKQNQLNDMEIYQKRINKHIARWLEYEGMVDGTEEEILDRLGDSTINE